MTHVIDASMAATEVNNYGVFAVCRLCPYLELELSSGGSSDGTISELI